jgi:hypothetical protein
VGTDYRHQVLIIQLIILVVSENIKEDRYHCHKCTSPGVKGRNLIVCIDGTSNQFGEKVCSEVFHSLYDCSTPHSQNTNVIELYSQIVKDEGDHQLTYYNSGIGTYAKPSWWTFNRWKLALYNTIDLAIAWYEDIASNNY